MQRSRMGIFFKRSLTLVELLTAISLISVLVLGIYSLDTYSRFHLLASDHRARIQNEVTYVLEHMTKNITGKSDTGGAIGDITQLPSSAPIDITSGIGGDTAVKVYMDSNFDGKRDSSDKQVAYRFRSASEYQIWYYSNYTDFPASYNIIAKRINGFNPLYSSTNDYLQMQISACWDPDGNPFACATQENPQVNIITRIKMPSVSIN